MTPPPKGYYRGATRLDRVALCFCLLLLGGSVLYPTLRLFVEALARGRFDVLMEGTGLAAARNTLFISLASVAGAGFWGTGLALAVHRVQFPGRAVLSVLAYLPFCLPPLVGVLGFYYLIGRDGLFLRLIEQVFEIPYAALPGPWAILLVHIYSFYVFFYAMAGAALESRDYAQCEAARTLGAGPLRVFLRITLPQLRPALQGAALLTFMSSAASFSAPYFFGQDFPMLSVQIFNERSQFQHENALSLTLLLAVVSLLGVLLFRSVGPASGAASKGVRTPIRRRSLRWLAGSVAWLGILVLLTPHLTILWLSLVDHRAWHAELIPTAFSLENYTRIWRDPAAFIPIRNSLWMSALAAVAALTLALPAAYLIGRRRPGGRWLNLLVMLPWALPGSVVAMNLIVAFNERWMPLYNTVWILPLAYFIRNVPLLTRMATAAIEPFDAGLFEAGRTLGASRGYCFRRIAVPLLMPAIAAATALAFATTLGEFVASILLYTPGNIPISVKINMEWRAAAGTAFAYSVLLMLLAGVAFALARRFSSRML